MKGVQDALSRLSGAREVTVHLQDGWIVAATDPAARVVPSRYWGEILRIGFPPERMEVRATGTFEAGHFVLDGGRWPLIGGATKTGPARVRLRVESGAEDPPRVEVME